MGFDFILANIAPIFLIVLLGTWLKHKALINDNFISVSSKLIFNITLPVLIFLKVAAIDISTLNNTSASIGIIYGATLLIYALSWIIGARTISVGKDIAAFLQGLFRGSFATIGLAAANSIYGPSGLSQAALLVALIVPFYNILGVTALTLPLSKEHKLTLVMVAKELFFNPIVIAVIIAIPFSLLNISVPLLINNTGYYLAELTIPLALLGIGGTLKLRQNDYALSTALASSIIKVAVLPITGFAIIWCWHDSLMLDTQTLGIIFIALSCPTTSASFIMAQAMGANYKLAGAIVVISTGLAAFVLPLGLYLLSFYG